jgi:hypothetical protein
MIEAGYSPETSPNFCATTLQYIPQDSSPKYTNIISYTRNNTRTNYMTLQSNNFHLCSRSENLFHRIMNVRDRFLINLKL